MTHISLKRCTSLKKQEKKNISIDSNIEYNGNDCKSPFTKKQTKILQFVLSTFVILLTASMHQVTIWYQETLTAKKNAKIDAFKNNEKFICNVSMGRYYLVSVDKNWTLRNEYFKKDELLLLISSCEKDM